MSGSPLTALGGVPPGPHDLAELVANRVLEELEPVLADLGASKPASVLVDAATLARELGVSRRFVYEHAGELGARRLSAGKRSRLRFDVGEAKAAWRSLEDHVPRRPEERTPAAQAAPRQGIAGLLPIRGPVVE